MSFASGIGRAALLGAVLANECWAWAELALPEQVLALPAELQLQLRVGSAIATSSSPATSGPAVAPSWTAEFVLHSPVAGGQLSKGRIAYDRPRQRIRQTLTNHEAFFTKEDVQHQDQLNVNTTGLNANYTIGLGRDAVCKAMTSPFIDNFAILAATARNGSGIVDGTPCEVWAAEVPVPSTHSTFWISACISDQGVPLDINQTAPYPTSAGFVRRTTFFNVTVGHVGDSAFANSHACTTNYPTKPCPWHGSGSVVDLSVYRIHGADEPLQLENRNVGDALGDLAFVCIADAVKQYKDKLVSSWDLQANASFGQYGYCIYTAGKNLCIGGSQREVGRESAIGLGRGELQGQCSPNNDVGSWYSIPAEGQCPAGQAIGTGGCTWGGAVRKRTVAASCILQDRGLAASCVEELTHAPFSRSAAIFYAALAPDDPAKGGCPNVLAVAPLPSSPPPPPLAPPPSPPRARPLAIARTTSSTGDDALIVVV